MCRLCGDMFRERTDLEEHMADEHNVEFGEWLRENRFDDFIAWAEDRYWDEFVEEQLNGDAFDEWAEDNSTEVEVPGD